MDHYQTSSFARFSRFAAHYTGKPVTFIAATAIIIFWALSGPVFGFSDTWQLVINTGTTIVTFLMVFLIQNTQNRDTEAVHIKLDEVIRATRRARNVVLDLEELDETELDHIRREYLDLAEHARTHIEQKRRARGDES